METKFSTLKEAKAFIEDEGMSPALVQELIKNDTVDTFSKLLLSVAIQGEFIEFLEVHKDDERLASLWDESHFKNTLVKDSKLFMEVLKNLLDSSLKTIKEVLQDSGISKEVKMYVIEQLNKVPDFTSAKTLNSTYDKDIADFLILSKELTMFPLEVLKIQNGEEIEGGIYPIDVILPFISEEKFRKAFFKTNDLNHFKEAVGSQISDELVQILKNDVLAKMGAEQVLNEIKGSSQDYDAVLVDFDSMLFDYESTEKNRLMKLFFDSPKIYDTQKDMIRQAFSANIPVKLTLEYKNDNVYLNYPQQNNAIVRQFFMNAFNQCGAILKRMPVSSLEQDKLASMFSGREMSSGGILSAFESLLSDSKGAEPKKVVINHIDDIIPELKEVFDTFPRVEGVTNFSAEKIINKDNVIYNLILDNNKVNISSEGDRFLISSIKNEDSLLEELPELLGQFVNNMNTYIEGNA